MMGQGIGQGVGMGQMGQGIQQQGQYYEQNIPQSQGQNVPLQQQQGFGQGISPGLQSDIGYSGSNPLKKDKDYKY